MISLAELHGLIVHLPLLSVPTLAVLTVLAWRGRGGDLPVRAEPWVFGAAAVGAVIAVLTGLTVFQNARTELRSQQWLAWGHLGVGLILALVLVAVGWWRRKHAVSAGALAAVALVSLALVGAGGWMGGRMVYVEGVGVHQGGQFDQTAQGAELLAAGLAGGKSMVALGRQAFRTGLGCSSCHGMDAKGGSGPPLAGGIDLGRFRRTHGNGLFPTDVVSDRMFAALNAWLKTLPYVPHGDG